MQEVHGQAPCGLIVCPLYALSTAPLTSLVRLQCAAALGGHAVDRRIFQCSGFHHRWTSLEMDQPAHTGSVRALGLLSGTEVHGWTETSVAAA